LKWKLIARIISQMGRFFTGVEIHPNAWIEGGVFIDHGSGVVIGETAEVHKGTVIYQGVTLGGTGKEHGKRHPTIMENVTLSAGAKVLGGFTVGKGAKIGAGAVVLKEVPEYATVVGVPGRIVRIRKPDETVDATHAGVIAVTALNAEISLEEQQRKEEEAKEMARLAEEKRSGKKQEEITEKTEKEDENL
jgi:serine O-acetyltransferase